MKSKVQSWHDVLSQMIQKPKNKTVSILYPSSRTKLASHIAKAVQQIGLRTIKFEVDPYLEMEKSPEYLSSILDNLDEEDFLVVIRGDDFIRRLKLNNHFNTYSGLINGSANSIVLHMLIDDNNLTYLCDVDYDELIEYTLKLQSKIQNNQLIRITSPNGTDLSFHPRKWNIVPIKPDNIVKNALLPGGQLYTAPVETKTNGTIVVDRCISEFPIDFKEIIPFPRIENRIEITIENGRITDIIGKDEANFLKNNCLSRADSNGWILGEVTFGTNPKRSSSMSNAIQEILRDTVHFGFGLNTHLGGDIVSNVHWDAVIEFDTNDLELRK